MSLTDDGRVRPLQVSLLRLPPSSQVSPMASEGVTDNGNDDGDGKTVRARTKLCGNGGDCLAVCRSRSASRPRWRWRSLGRLLRHSALALVMSQLCLPAPPAKQLQISVADAVAAAAAGADADAAGAAAAGAAVVCQPADALNITCSDSR